jgi:sarcosine oxidase subunit beta
VDGRLRVTSGAQPWHGAMAHDADGRPRVPVTTKSLARTIDTVGAILPVFADVPVAAVWAGLLDLTPDALPVIDRVDGADGLVVAAGFSGHGFGIGPVTGELAADLVLGRTPAHDLEPFRLARFATVADAEPAALTLHG